MDQKKNMSPVLVCASHMLHVCFSVGSLILCSRPNTAPQRSKWRRASARYARSGSSWPGQTLRGPSSSSRVWQTWVPPVKKHMSTQGDMSFLQSKPKQWKWEDDFDNKTGILSVKEFLQRGCLLLGDDNAQDWEEPAGSRPQELHSAGNACSKAEQEGGHMMTWEVNVSTCSPRQHKGLSRRSDMFTLYTERNQVPLVVVNHLHSRPVPPLLCSPASFPSLFLHLHPLFLLFCSSSLSASSASPWTTRSTCASSWVTCRATWTGKAWSGPWRSRAAWRGRSRFTRRSTGSCSTWTWTCREKPSVSSRSSPTRLACTEHEHLRSNYTETMRHCALINPFCRCADAAGAAEVHPAHQPVSRLHQ